LGQQGREPRASWVREREETIATSARRANADFIRYFKINSIFVILTYLI